MPAPIAISSCDGPVRRSGRLENSAAFERPCGLGWSRLLECHRLATCIAVVPPAVVVCAIPDCDVASDGLLKPQVIARWIHCSPRCECGRRRCLVKP
jgi:hypothetical protein